MDVDIHRRKAEAKRKLKSVFGFSSLRPFQDTVTSAILEGRDVLAVSGTGSGKSLTFQLPSLVLPGVTIVVSPLLALMRDQCNKMKSLGVKACRLTSDEDRSTVRHALQNLKDYNLVYVSPEKAKTTEFKLALQGVPVAMFAVDEAHIASRALDFRASYAALGTLFDQHEEAVRFACTATADTTVEIDVRRLCRLRDPLRVVSSPWRDNIRWEFVQEASEHALCQLVEQYQQRPGSQVIYTSSRKASEELSGILSGRGLDSVYYHAGMEPGVRARTQEHFMEGVVKCVVATSAFGMGVDKAQPLWAKVLTPGGWKRMGNLNVGDLVVAADGTVTRVVAVHDRGVLPAFRVTFDDGASTVCADDHKWAVITPKERMRGQGYSVQRLADFRSKLKDRAGNRLRFVPLVAPVPTHPALLPLDPYLLGALLGDGGLTTRAVKFTTADAWMVREIRRLVPHPVRVRPYSHYSFGLVYSKGRRNPVRAALDALGLRGAGSHNKHVPDVYMHASVADRLAVLQGLFDTDGSVAGAAQTSVMYVTVSPALRDAVIYLSRSLGGLATADRKADAWYVSVRLPPSFAPFRLPAKARRYRVRTKYQLRRSIDSVTPVGEEAMRCITIAHPSGLYVTDDFIVTHNSDIRLVANWQLPASLFDLLQQVGRGSRDGKDALGWVNLGTKAEKAQRFFIEMANPPHRVYERLWAQFEKQSGPSKWNGHSLLRVAGIRDDVWSGQLDAAMSYLEFTGHISTSPGGVSYHLPVKDKYRANNLCRIYGGYIKEGVVIYDVAPGKTDNSKAFVMNGCCDFGPGIDCTVVRPLESKLSITPDMVDDKYIRAVRQLDMIEKFSTAKDPKAFVERVFAKGD